MATAFESDTRPIPPIVIIGGSLVGLSTALFLSAHSVPTILLERHAHSSPHPRAIGYGPRTMEILRAVGLGEDIIPRAPPFTQTRKARVESLAGKWFEEEPWTTAPKKSGDEGKGGKNEKIEYSPCGGAAIAQDTLEPILRNRAVELGADIRMGHKFLRFEDDAKGINIFAQSPSGSDYSLTANYLIAADGHQSAIRSTLGIGTSGRGVIRTLRSILFRADLDQYLESGVSQFNINQEGLKGAFMTTYRDGRWVLMFSPDQSPTDGNLEALVCRAIGREDVPIEIITTGLWESSAFIADRFSSSDSRFETAVFLVGDAAHTLPPSRGGFGANTGIEDAHNLAWKIAEVSSRRAGKNLLATYEEERRPVAWLRYRQLFARMDPASGAVKPDDDNGTDLIEKNMVLDDDAIEFGQLYRSSAVLGASEDLLPARTPSEWAGQPGTRAPHIWASRQGNNISTLDLFQRGWVLLFEERQWKAPVAKVGGDLGIKLEGVQVGHDVRISKDRIGSFKELFGFGPQGASLIRPDGYIAWRSVDLPADSENVLKHTLSLLLCAAKIS